MPHQHPFELEHDGQTLRGMVYRPTGAGRRPTVLLLHGFTGQRMESGFAFVKLGRTLAQRGVAAVTFDFLHSGESDGSFDQMLVTGEVADAVRVTRWAQGQPFVDRSRLGVLGFSLGGLVACCTTARTGAFAALALMAPTTVENLCRFAGGDSDEPVTIGPHTLHPRFFDDVRTLDPVADAARHPRPTLLVQGSGDTAVPPEVSAAYAERMKTANVPLKELHIQGADHGFSKPHWRKKLITSVSDFFAQTLRAGTHAAGAGLA